LSRAVELTCYNECVTKLVDLLKKLMQPKILMRKNYESQQICLLREIQRVCFAVRHIWSTVSKNCNMPILMTVIWI